MISELFPRGVVTREAAPEDWEGVIHPAEAACVARVAPKRRREFTAGRCSARRALEALGVLDFALVPDTDRVPRWPTGIVGSISHCKGYCGVAVARAAQFESLGFDVELAGPLDEALVARVCSAEEIRALENLPDLGFDWAKLIFSAKESTYKCYFPPARTFLGFDDVAVTLDPEGARFTARLVRTSTPAAHGHREFRGRFAHGDGRVFTAVALPAES